MLYKLFAKRLQRRRERLAELKRAAEILSGEDLSEED